MMATIPSNPERMRTADAIAERVRASALLHTAWMERLWSEGQTSPDQGLAIQSGEVRRILSDRGAVVERYRRFITEDEEAARLEKIAVEAESVLEHDSFWHHIVEVFALTKSERDLLALCVATELDSRLGRVLAYLADDTRATMPTSAAAAALFDWTDDLPTAMTDLLRWRLAYPTNGELAWRAATAWQVDQALVLSVKAERWIDPTVEPFVRVTSPDEAKRMPCLYPDVLTHMLFELNGDNLKGNNGELEIVLAGTDGSGRETLAAQFAAGVGSPLVSVNTRLLGPVAGIAPESRPESRSDAMVRAARQAIATGAKIFWRDAETVTATEWQEVNFPTGLRGMQEMPATATHRYVLKPLPTAQRLEAWAYYCNDEVPEIVRTQRLTPAEIKLVAKAAGDAAVHVALRRAVEAHRDLMQPLPCPYTWDDLVVSADVQKKLKDFEAQVLLRWEVYEDWGFSRLTHLGQGISALFGGPSGTGKTMAAQVLARSLGLELYRVDLAGVVNKYVGETEKRLRDVFDACERSGGLLFFDEADALFGSRMQVKDAHDRFANIEIDYLLQRIEQFDGIAILATNRKNDLDAAFLRRLRFVVDFLNPDKRERRILWEKSLPACAPDGRKITGEINFALLAEELDLNGAHIKAIALGAAFLARSAGTTIGMEQIELAAQREYAKQGKLQRLPLGKAAVL